MDVKLVKLESNHRNLRTDEVVGQASGAPVAGETFRMTAPPLEGGSIRVIRTSPVQSVEFDQDLRKYVFKTLNSTYELHLLPEDAS